MIGAIILLARVGYSPFPTRVFHFETSYTLVKADVIADCYGVDAGKTPDGQHWVVLALDFQDGKSSRVALSLDSALWLSTELVDCLQKIVKRLE